MIKRQLINQARN